MTRENIKRHIGQFVVLHLSSGSSLRGVLGMTESGEITVSNPLILEDQDFTDASCVMALSVVPQMRCRPDPKRTGLMGWLDRCGD